MRRSLRLGAALAIAPFCSGCVDWQSALHPEGPQASAVYGLLRLFAGVCGIIWLFVVLALVLTTRRRGSLSDVAKTPEGERGRLIVVSFCVAATIVTVAALTLASYWVTRGLAGPAADDLTIRLTGYQWWWKAIYPDSRPDKTFEVANEIHIPVDSPVRVELQSEDVIHSFWVPSLAGKLDLIPGRDNAIRIRADRPGIYRGQCAQFCGLQHAHMAMLVIAETREAFDAWRDAQRRDAVPPLEGEAQQGGAVFQQKACASCHAIRGTQAAGTLGPDLTHVASRGYIAAGLVPTTRGSLAAWIADPQTMKPGNNMPDVPLTALELRQVSAYLAALK